MEVHDTPPTPKAAAPSGVNADPPYGPHTVPPPAPEASNVREEQPSQGPKREQQPPTPEKHHDRREERSKAAWPTQNSQQWDETSSHSSTYDEGWKERQGSQRDESWYSKSQQQWGGESYQRSYGYMGTRMQAKDSWSGWGDTESEANQKRSEVVPYRGGDDYYAPYSGDRSRTTWQSSGSKFSQSCSCNTRSRESRITMGS